MTHEELREAAREYLAAVFKKERDGATSEAHVVQAATAIVLTSPATLGGG